MFRKKMKLDIKNHEHNYCGKHHNISYLEYRKKGSGHLLVTLSGFNGREIEKAPAKYNYMRTLADININKLFIKDEIADIPVYYMGSEGTSHYLEDVCRLIEEKLMEMNVEKEQLIIAGSSKGGTGALLIGLRLGAGHIIAGANQLDVGSYLDSLNEELSHLLLTKVAGKITENTVKEVDQKFREHLLVDMIESQLYFHAGNRDNHYHKHMRTMLDHFDMHKILYDLELRHYAGHENVKYYFPEFFTRKVREIISLPFIEHPEVTKKTDGTRIRIRTANDHESVDWAIYVYRKDGETIKILYGTEEFHTVPVELKEILSIKVFLRVHGEKKQVKEFQIS